MTKATGFKSLGALDKEIKRLQVKAKTLEDRLDDQFEHIQAHFPGMLLNSILPVKRETEGPAAQLVRLFTGNAALQKSLGRLADFLAEKATDGLDSLLGKLFKKKEA